MFINELLEFWTFPFFYRALIVGILMSLVLSWLGAYVVLRREVVLTHAIPNMAFLGVVLAFMFDYSITLAIVVFTLISALSIDYVRKKNLIHSDSILETFAQFGLATSVIVLSFVKGYQVNLTQFLFGDILAISNSDIFVSVTIFLLVFISVLFWHKNFLRLSLSHILSHSTVKNKKLWHTFLVLLLAICIGLAMKIVGILLVSAFATIPANIAKLLAKSIKQTFVFSLLIGGFATLIGLNLSALWDIPSGANIVMLLILVLFLTLLFVSGKKNVV